MRYSAVWLAGFACSAALAVELPQRTLSFEHRVKAQEAIERVYYAHQIGATRAFEDALPRAVLENKVRKYLAQTATLETDRKTAVTDEMLQRELDRIANGTKMPERLRELYDALGNDPWIIKECLARAILVERLSRNASISDPNHDAAVSPDRSGRDVSCIADAWTPTATIGAPAVRFGHTAVWTGSLMIVWGGDSVEGLTTTGGRYDPATDTWTPTSTTGAPIARYGHTTVWTGNSMVVWGGNDFFESMNTGGRYDPGTDSWTPMSMTGAPSPRFFHTAVWTGSRMVVWGGWGDDPVTTIVTLDTGGRYDPTTDSWTPTSTTGAPSARVFQTAVWTGSRMVVWGGFGNPGDVNTGGRYDPASDSWTPTSVIDAPESREWHTAVWTGSQMVVWGGFDDPGSSVELNTGGRYDPLTDVWTATATTGAPSGRQGMTSVWTGDVMIVWGGFAGGLVEWFNSGGRYDPATDSWAPTLVAGAPSPRSGHSAVWTGSFMVVWGGEAPPVDTGAAYSVEQPTTTWYRDLDGDGYGNIADSVTIPGCDGPAGRVRDFTDCNDTNAGVHPGAAELCDALDDDCDGQIDEDAQGIDDDGDGIRSACDNCPSVRNPNQSDFDHDGQGDDCDGNDGLIYVYGPHDRNHVEWQPESGFAKWNRYRGSLAALRATGQYTQAPGLNPLAARDCGLTYNYVLDADVPGPGEAAFSLVTGVSGSVESGLGKNSAGVPRANAHPCP